ncbi:unnamed protein product [Calicophoron daubneyi]|uniref:Galactosylgalactosylxylosylprotein 3-beta-glucuronosyltransferase n=1 Tax=Calicophoron daubneyi TaxID=300641 RepID=A0AAV2TSL9_CALDB
MRIRVLPVVSIAASFTLVFIIFRNSERDARIPVKTFPYIYILTATYKRLVQRAELTRLCNTFRNIKNVHWVVCEDSQIKSNLTGTLLAKCGVPYTHLNVETPPHERPQPNEPYWFRPKGIAQRNMGLQWLRQNLVLGKHRGVLYIADDDNTYSLEVFNQMRSTVRVSTWPVAFAGELLWEGCVTSAENRSRIVRMWSAYKPERPFPIDMAAFAVNIDLILTHPGAKFDYNRPRGMQESQFLLDLGLKNWEELEPKADGCQQILVWHTRTADPVLAVWRRLESQGVVAPPLIDPV